MYKGIVFDVDGTLLDSESMVRVSLQQVAEEYGLTLTAEQWEMSKGCPSHELMEKLGLGDRAHEAAEHWIAMMEEMVKETKLYPGVPQLLRVPFRRGVVTSQTRLELGRNFPRLGIADQFSCVVCADDTPYRKPHPYPLLHCVEAMGLSPADVLFVGDTQYDQGCADAAGVDFALAYWGAGSTKGFEQAAHILRDPLELLPLVEQQSPSGAEVRSPVC